MLAEGQIQQPALAEKARSGANVIQWIHITLKARKPFRPGRSLDSFGAICLERHFGLGDVLMALGAAKALKEMTGKPVYLSTSEAFRDLMDAAVHLDGVMIGEESLACLENDFRNRGGVRRIALDPAKFGISGRHQIDAYLDHLGLTAGPGQKEIVLDSGLGKGEAGAFLAILPPVAEGRKRVLVHAAVTDPNRTWPRGKWAVLCDRLRHAGHQVVLIGNSSAIPNRGIHAFEIPGVFSAVDQLGLLGTLALMEASDVLISTDSGPIQLAGATSIHIIGLYTVVAGKTRLPFRNGVAGWNATALEPQCPYSPCYQWMHDEDTLSRIAIADPKRLFSDWCPAATCYDCLANQISVDGVFAAFEKAAQNIQPRGIEAADREQSRGAAMSGQSLADGLTPAIEKKMDAVSLISMCEQLDASGETALSIALYKEWLKNNPDNTLYYAVYFNLGLLFGKTNDLSASREAFAATIRAKPDFIPAYIQLGGILERLGAAGDAVGQWQIVVNMLSGISGESVAYKLSVLNQIGRVLENTPFEEVAEDALQKSIEIRQDFDVVQHWIALRQKQCKWPVLREVTNTTRQALLSGMSPHCVVFHSDDPLFHLSSAFSYYKRKVGQPEKSFHTHHRGRRSEAKDGARIRIGYLSSYFREHAHGYLTAELYRLHDRSKVEVFAYSCNERTGDRIEARIMEGVDHWVDLNGMTDEQAAQKIFDDKIDILIDFNGYTGKARLKIVAMRPAPIIVNWLGYPGSMGTPYHNYIIADDAIIPKESEKYYSEKVLRLPCYQPNDRSRLVADLAWTRQAAGLPEDGIVFCAFNGVQKITASMWQRYMSILAQVPGSVLWLLDGYEATTQRLRAMALAQGIASERLIFAPTVINAQHLSRYPLADIFLDTAPCGAHTTASDALWMGVPVLTAPGRGFAARVCSSLVKSAGLGDLICNSLDDYVVKAVQLGNSKEKLARFRTILRDNHDRCDLFNIEKLVVHLDALFVQMWNEYKGGCLPRPDLSNLDIYNGIGMDLDCDDAETANVADYEGLYLQRLREMHDYSPIKYDQRLWRKDEGLRPVRK
jgi:predicted O-linked N-acetylglucosamine transferase (SPINDLY family)